MILQLASLSATGTALCSTWQKVMEHGRYDEHCKILEVSLCCSGRLMSRGAQCNLKTMEATECRSKTQASQSGSSV